MKHIAIAHFCALQFEVQTVHGMGVPGRAQAWLGQI